MRHGDRPSESQYRARARKTEKETKRAGSDRVREGRLHRDRKHRQRETDEDRRNDLQYKDRDR